eukprot:1160409-Pelagomonas_calceolata.AAC.10
MDIGPGHESLAPPSSPEAAKRGPGAYDLEGHNTLGNTGPAAENHDTQCNTGPAFDLSESKALGQAVKIQDDEASQIVLPGP